MIKLQVTLDRTINQEIMRDSQEQDNYQDKAIMTGSTAEADTWRLARIILLTRVKTETSVFLRIKVEISFNNARLNNERPTTKY